MELSVKEFIRLFDFATNSEFTPSSSTENMNDSEILNKLMEEEVGVSRNEDETNKAIEDAINCGTGYLLFTAESGPFMGFDIERRRVDPTTIYRSSDADKLKRLKSLWDEGWYCSEDKNSVLFNSIMDSIEI